MYLFVFHFLAILCWHSYYFHMGISMFWMEVAVWNGACFYMDYFGKRYE